MLDKFNDLIAKLFLSRSKFEVYLKNQAAKAVKNVLAFLRRLAKTLNDPKLAAFADDVEELARKYNVVL